MRLFSVILVKRKLSPIYQSTDWVLVWKSVTAPMSHVVLFFSCAAFNKRNVGIAGFAINQTVMTIKNCI